MTKQVGEALQHEGQQRTGRLVSIGIGPWGIVERNHELLGHNRDIPYVSISSPRYGYGLWKRKLNSMSWKISFYLLLLFPFHSLSSSIHLNDQQEQTRRPE